MIDSEVFIANLQRAIKDERCAFTHDTQVIGLIIVGFALIVQKAAGLHHRFAYDLFALGRKGAQVAVVTGFQNALAITHINWMRRAIDQRSHKFVLITECPFGDFPLANLAPHIGIPDQ